MAGPDGDLFSLVTSLFLFFFMIAWSVGVSLLGMMFLGTLFGGEIAYLSPGKIVIRKQLFGAGFAMNYVGKNISNLRRYEPESESPKMWRGSHMCFEYEGETIHFGSNIDRRKAELLVADIEDIVINGEPEITERDAAEPVIEENRAVKLEPDALTVGSPSVIALILANVIPILGVLFFDWSIGEVMLLYWAESGVVGVFNLAKMWVINKVGAVLLGTFFVGHFGGFMVGHLLFIYAFFIKDPSNNTGIPLTDVTKDFILLMPALIGLFISHGISFKQNFLGHTEYSDKMLGRQMMEPYRRIFVMHITLIIGGMLTMMLSNALPALLLMIVLKTMADLKAHLNQHK